MRLRWCSGYLVVAVLVARIGCARAAVPGETTVGELRWDRPGLALPAGAAGVEISGGRTFLRVRRTNDSAIVRVPLWHLDAPGLSNRVYTIRGEVKYSGVSKKSHLEMWNYFLPAKAGQPEAAYFSRTLGDGGPMAAVVGDSDWREFMLPFDSTGAAGPPIRLDVALILNGAGDVAIGPLRLVQFGTGPVASEWWSREQSNRIGAIGGSLGGLAGAAAGVFAGRRRARWFVFSLLWGMAALGLVGTVGAVVAYWGGQPVWVWSPLLLFGVLALAIVPGVTLSLRRQWAELELRRMRAMDAGVR